MISNIIFFTILACFSNVFCEAPSNGYGTPLGAPLSSYGTPNYDANDHSHHEYGEPKAYEFGYQVRDDYTGNNYNRQESSDGNQVRGEYRVALPDGRTQIVTYWADWQTGFHADVRYEGEAHYPEQYNNQGYNYQHGGNNEPSNQYGVPAGFNNNAHNGGYSGYNNALSNKQRPSNEYGAP
ncbi:hypothetical protein WA026_012841 [Henosepilachna vigintioctopunctata]|uniref:Pro-resilin-like n=1 Tax=Henosepilachna vigintioctopunctata TaxID=420089 RepID=A0AAW1TK14_9CUCU